MLSFLDAADPIDCLVALIFIILIWLYDYFVLRKTKSDQNEDVQLPQKTGGSSEKEFELQEIPMTPEEKQKKDIAAMDPKVPLAKQPISFDEYEDKGTYFKRLPSFAKEFTNVVVDGANFIHYIKPKNHYDHTEYVEKSIKLLRKKIPNKHIYFIVKDETHYNKESQEAEKEKNEAKLRKLAKNPFVHIMVSSGESKARDDYLAILMTELLGEKTILLTRDRYRDIQNISGSHTNEYKIFSKQEKKIRKMLNSIDDTTVGKWSFMKKNVGYTTNEEIQEGFWERRPYKNSDASERAFVFYL